ncbi:acetyltransferase [Mycobacterium bourgelatii]|uniref:Acyltransferase n=2 Tax=Mycobacterium bourgelatii TaxID=1273442 RepID=A0A7I9YHY5_MYCBU|nr:acetyltransferase [Mycobacterium bourgelatii]GFG88152.1 acyltransferase [Mycobacterium bourgelatii]
MRALAVTAVVLYHLNPAWLPGGYLGVDVFFVISGFLITRLLIAERATTGRISLRQFWIRRARRILSPLLPMLFVTVAATALVDRSMLHALRTEVLGALSFTSNWVQISEHQSYFAKYGPPSLLQHLWSLAVEEQFYVIWPAIVIAVLYWCLRKTRVSGSHAVAIVAGVGALTSATAMAALYQPGTDPSPIYYSTVTHAAGLFTGAVLAVAWPAVEASLLRWSLNGYSLRGALAGVGLFVVALGYWLLDEYGSATYQGGILAVSAACALLIVGAGHGTTTIGRLLSRPSVCWVGARSYGLYLWHWPVFVLGDRILGHRTLMVAAVEVAVAVLLAAGSYRWIERPVLRHGYRAALHAGWRAVRGGRAGRLLVAGAALATSVFVLASLVWAPPPPLTGLDKQLAEALAVQAAQEASAAPTPPLPAVATPAAGTDTAPEPVGPPPGDQISAVGDSVMLASSLALRDRLPGIWIDAVTNRGMQAAPDILASLAANGLLRPVVLLGLGTNGAFPRELLENILETLGPDRKVFLVNLYLHDRPWTDGVNQTLTEVALAHPANVHLIDWQSAVSGHEDLLYDDHIHPQPGAGADLYAETVIEAMIEAEKPAPPPPPVVAPDPVVNVSPGPSPQPSAAPRRDGTAEFGFAAVVLVVLLVMPVTVLARAYAAGLTGFPAAVLPGTPPQVGARDCASAACTLFALPTRARSPPTGFAPVADADPLPKGRGVPRLLVFGEVYADPRR